MKNERELIRQALDFLILHYLHQRTRFIKMIESVFDPDTTENIYYPSLSSIVLTTCRHCSSIMVSISEKANFRLP
ncbi:hypothetical protein ACQKL5_02695 [Peribacillus sp. NPDC097675]|uniref:hypothetical protein n=1 Tax=Peribacillus sp. NPDC097675 TaxID=3390618 RepID=UPI003CFF2FAE